MKNLSRNIFSNSSIRGILILCMGICLASCVPNLEAQPSKTFRTNGKNINVKELNSEINQMMAEVGVPGMSLAIIENNEIVFYQPFGLKELEENEKLDDKTVFNGCSLSKSLLLFVANQLVDEGKLELDKPMYTYLPNKRLEHDPRYKSITPRMILGHSSGLENWQFYNHPALLEILTPPGEEFVYSGEGYNYLAEVIEKILGKSYDEYIDERVIKPLKLKNTYLKHVRNDPNNDYDISPSNYAWGHEVFGDERENINFASDAASGAHFTAEDYAKLIIGLFDPARFSAERIKEIHKPVSKVDKEVFYAHGFEMVRTPADTIIAHGGSNPGYKNWVFYSTKKKRGIVFLTNSDKGELMANRLVQMTVGLNIDAYINSWYGIRDQYPSPATDLLKTYTDKGTVNFYKALEASARKGEIKANTLSTLGLFFSIGSKDSISKDLTNRIIEAHPDSAVPYYHQGRAALYDGGGDYLSKVTYSLEKLEKAKNLGYNRWTIDYYLQQCYDILADVEQRKGNIWQIAPKGKTVLEAEDYTSSRGKIYLYPTKDENAGQKVTFFFGDDCLDYKLKVNETGSYLVTLRVATNNSESANKLDLYVGDQLVKQFQVKSTGDWDKFESVTSEVQLPKGAQTLRMCKTGGELNINWLTLSASEAK